MPTGLFTVERDRTSTMPYVGNRDSALSWFGRAPVNDRHRASRLHRHHSNQDTPGGRTYAVRKVPAGTAPRRPRTNSSTYWYGTGES